MTQPPAASLVAVPSATLPPCPQVEITATPPATSATITIWRVSDGEREIVRGANRRVVAGATVLVDYESQLNQAVHYEMLGYTAAGAQVGTYVNSPTITLGGGTACAGWLQAPGIPFLSMQVEVVTDSPTTRSVTRDVLRVMGRKRAVVLSGQRSDREQTWQIITRSLADRRILLSIMDAANPVLLRMIYGVDTPGGYLAVADLEEKRNRANDPRDPVRWWTFDAVVVDAPSVGYGLQTHNWGELKSTWPTWGDVKTNYTSWLGVLRDPTKAS